MVARLTLALAAAALLPALARAQDFVLVKRGAFLYAAPDTAAERARDPWAREHGVRLGPFWPMRELGERDGFVEVAPIAEARAAAHCYPGTAALAGLEIRLWVRGEDLAPVVARDVTKTFPDGASLTLLAGVGLTPKGRDQYDAHVPGATVRVTLEPHEVARRYRPTEHIAIGRMVNALLAPGAQLELARGTRLTTEPRGRRGRRSRVVDFTAGDAEGGAGEPPRATLAVEAPPGASAGRVRATVRTECLEASGFLRARDLTTDRPTRPASGIRQGRSLRPGAALYWPDGSRAGRAGERASLEGDITPSGPHLCFAHPLRSGVRASADVALSLCVDRTAVSRRR